MPRDEIDLDFPLRRQGYCPWRDTRALFVWGTQRQGKRSSGLLGPEYELDWLTPKHDAGRCALIGQPWTPAACPLRSHPGFAVAPLADGAGPGRDILLVERPVGPAGDHGRPWILRGWVAGFEAALDPSVRGKGLGAELFLAAALWRGGPFGDSVSAWYSDAGAACAAAAHTLAVGRAAARGLRIPTEVLADYPQVAQRIKDREANESRALARLLGGPPSR